ncbi:hypothetical protein Godav_017362 [Gossypium davidsonii]|uniref:Cytochrome b561 and DOMON domain-containing protein n=1 Tax=Gossypium davidsonii TaxID=34287 RepID=A0A7J8QT18_GOSDV|nr:hypothetical protein [Gossypium davidsonii]
MSPSSPAAFLRFTFWTLLISPAVSLTCSTQKFNKNQVFSTCIDLPSLSSYLHFTYDSPIATLSVAFVATPPKSGGWIAWAINPKATGMVGSQALVAYKNSTTGVPVVRTYDISSYSSIVPKDLSFAVWDKTAESRSDGSLISGYAIGVAGWGIGLKLGSESQGIMYSGHRNIGIALFVLATVQIFALFLRPNKDHKYRFYWNIYHHSVGYAVLVLGILNVFKGFDILNPDRKWKLAYMIIIIALGAISFLLEAITWVVVLKRKSGKSNKPYDGYNNGQGGRQTLAT